MEGRQRAVAAHEASSGFQPRQPTRISTQNPQGVPHAQDEEEERK